MKTIYLHCQKCGCWLGNLEEVKRGLCSLCHEKAVKILAEKFSKGGRGSLMDDFIAPVDLKG